MILCLPNVVNDVIVLYMAGYNDNDPEVMDVAIMLIKLLISYPFDHHSNTKPMCYNIK